MANDKNDVNNKKEKKVFDLAKIKQLRSFRKEPENPLDQFEEDDDEKKVSADSKRRKKKLIIKMLLVFAVIVAIGVLLYAYSRPFDNFAVTNTTDITDYSQLEYMEYMDNLVKYSKDGITYINTKGQNVWTESYAMKMPKASVSGEYIAVADLNGNQVYVFNSEGKVSSVEMPQNICAIDVGSQGVFVVVLEDSAENYINLYDKKGDIICEMQTTINKSGYPLDITLSEDGKKLFTSYIFLEGVSVKNGLAAYNFGSVGQNENSDRLMGGYTFDDTVIPKVEFLDNDTMCAFGDNQFVIYTMKEKPNEKATIHFEQEIKSVFNSREYIGVVYANDDVENSDQYNLEVFNTSGRSILKKSFDIAYNKIHLMNKQIVVVGDTECRVYSISGNLRFKYSFSEQVEDVIPTSNYNEYIILYENRLDVIRLRHSKE